MQSLLPETLNDPVLVAIVTLLVAGAIHYQRGLTFHEYRELARLKRRLFPVCEQITAPDSPLSNALERTSIPVVNFIASTDFDSFVHEKEMPEADPEYIAALDRDARGLWSLFVGDGWSPHLVSSVKRLPNGTRSMYHFVKTHDDGTQTEVYTFWTGVGFYIYAHGETEVTDVEGHLSDGIAPGDPRGVVGETLADV